MNLNNSSPQILRERYTRARFELLPGTINALIEPLEAIRITVSRENPKRAATSFTEYHRPGSMESIEPPPMSDSSPFREMTRTLRMSGETGPREAPLPFRVEVPLEYAPKGSLFKIQMTDRVKYVRLSPRRTRLSSAKTAENSRKTPVCWLPRPCSSNDGQSCDSISLVRRSPEWAIG